MSVPEFNHSWMTSRFLNLRACSSSAVIPREKASNGGTSAMGEAR